MRQNPDRTIRGGGLWGANLLLFQSLPSTNSWATQHASRLKHGDVVRALRQPSGKGRFERSWNAPGRCCLTLSAIVNASSHQDFPDPVLLAVTAIAVRDALQEFGVHCKLKWPNDVMTDRGKIAGILAEKEGTSDALVLGIGLNVNITAPALAAMNFATPPVSMAVERDRLFDIDLVGRRLLIHLEKAIDSAWAHGPASIVARWAEADFLAGKQISILGSAGQVTGAYGGLQDSGQLRIVDRSGQSHLFWSGDVSVSGISTGE